jgi:EAL domain-containing protein (putative c-di-GMP-specific phosphodiesterase class I)
MAPARFVPIAEDSGLIVPIGRWVLREACAQTKKWQDLGLDPGFVSINISALEFRRRDFVDSVRRVLLDTGLKPKFIQLEIRESVLMHDAEASVLILNELKALGISIAVDDFGAGYSSLSYLSQFPIDVLKIDQSFVHAIGLSEEDSVIVSAAIAMGTNLKQRVVAQGVEDERQSSFLGAECCEEAQGFLFSRPLSAARFSALLRRAQAPSAGQELHFEQ